MNIFLKTGEISCQVNLHYRLSYAATFRYTLQVKSVIILCYCFCCGKWMLRKLVCFYFLSYYKLLQSVLYLSKNKIITIRKPPLIWNVCCWVGRLRLWTGQVHPLLTAELQKLLGTKLVILTHHLKKVKVGIPLPPLNQI